MSKIWAFDGIENNHDVYRGKDCMNKFCKTLREYTMKIANFEGNKKIPLTNEEYESYLNQRNCHICKTKLGRKDTTDKNYRKVKDHCHYTGYYRGAAHIVCNLRYALP